MFNILLKFSLYALLLILFVIGILAFFVWREFGALPSKERLEKFSSLPYFQNGEFQSPEPIITNFDEADEKMSMLYLFSTKNAPKTQLPMQKLTKNDFGLQASEFAFYWLGHSSLIAELNKLRVIFDPVFGNASPLPFMIKRYAPPPLSIKDLAKIDIVIITHNHYDHLERKTMQSLAARHFIVPLGLKETLVKWGVDEHKITELGWGDEVEIDGLKILAQTGSHYSARSPFDRNKTLWNSYVLRFKDKKIFVSGDSGYSSHFKKIGEKYGPFDLACIEIDGWNKAWKNTHIHPNDVLIAARELKTSALLPMHWGVFDMARHHWKESIELLYAQNIDLGFNINLLTPLMGQKFDINTTTYPWWQEVE